MLKELLIKLNQGELVKYDLHDVTLCMLKNLGDKNYNFRDKLIYSTLENWIFSDKYRYDELKEILYICLDNEHLFYDLDGLITNSVLMRSFSMIVIWAILFYDNKKSFLQNDDVIEVKTKIIKYLYKEYDLRGWDAEVGYAHSIAHGADVLSELAKKECLKRNDLIEILSLLKEKINCESYLYVNNEDERLAICVNNIIKGGLDENDLISFINNLGVGLNSNNYYISNNCKNFFQSLYFILSIDNRDNLNIVNEVEKIIKNRYRVLYGDIFNCCL